MYGVYIDAENPAAGRDNHGDNGGKYILTIKKKNSGKYILRIKLDKNGGKNIV